MRWQWSVIGVTWLLAGCPSDGSDVRQYGQTCVDTDECVRGLVCSSEAICRNPGEPGTFVEGDPCISSSQCALGLACDATGQCVTEGAPGTAGFDEACTTTEDCQFGLRCVDDLCKGLQIPLWAGGQCPDPQAETGDFRIYFNVPGGDDDQDFYRFPFPNDGRVNSSRDIDLEGHPTPGKLLDVVGDVVGNMIQVVEQDLDGRFGPNQAVFFRFSEFPDQRSISFGIPGQGNLGLVDVTPGMSSDDILPFRYELTSRPTPYICHNWLAVHPIDGRPLEPGHTYAVIVTRSVLDDNGNELSQDAEFSAVMAATRPTDDRIGRIWDAYGPLRTWLADRSIDPGTIAAAAVYTVQDIPRRAQFVRAATQAGDPPSLTQVIRCGDGADPFADDADPTRGCTDQSDLYDELQGLVSLPQFQLGDPPFKDAVDGGAIQIQSGTATPVRVDPVHVALTIPKGATMPEGGWPLVLYAHGTGGNYTSVIRSGFAGEHTVADVDGTEVRFAMLGFDAPVHGPRARPDNWKQAWLDVDPDAYDPDVLFFNPLNPRAARDNALQEAADLWSLVRFARSLDLDEIDSPTGQPIRFDMDQLYFVGHSQGGVVGPMFLAWEPEVEGAVLSGAGGLTINALLDKTSPYDIPSAVRIGLADPTLSRVHPLLNLAQQIAETGDGVNHAKFVLRSPPEGARARHVLQTFGLGDTYSPDSTQYPLARALGLGQFANGNTPLERIDEVTLPATANAANRATGVVVLYTAAGRDAHFVMFDRADAIEHVDAFLGSAVLDGTPTVE